MHHQKDCKKKENEDAKNLEATCNRDDALKPLGALEIKDEGTNYKSLKREERKHFLREVETLLIRHVIH